MGNNPIEISGITPLSQFPKCPPHHPCTQFCEIDKLCIPCKKITIQSIKQVCLKICINSFKIICTPAGKKLVIDGKKLIKVLFESDEPHQAVHSADFDIPFCTFVLLKDIQDEVVQICSVVEDITVKCLDWRCLTVTSIIFVCPVFKKGYQLSPCLPDHAANYHLQGKHSMTQDDYHQQQQCTYHVPPDQHHCSCHIPHNKQETNYPPPHNYHPQSICAHCQSYLNR